MRALLLLVLASTLLLWWDIHDKILICISWEKARRYIDRNVSNRARTLFSLASFTVGLRLRCEINEDDLPDQMILVANHQSVIDIVVIMAAFQLHSIRFVAKAELKRWFPAVSRVLRVQRHALIPRFGNYNQAMRELDRLRNGLRDRECPVIFAEGSRSHDGSVKPFQSGAIRRLHAGRPLPLVALALDGGYHFVRVSDLTRLPKGHEYRISVAATFPAAKGKQELLEQIRQARDAIQEILRCWRHPL